MVFPIFPPEASSMAEKVDALFSYEMAICGLFLTGIATVMTYWLIKYRRGHPAYRKQRRISTIPFELTWMIIPLFFFLSFFVWGANLYFSEGHAPADSMVVHVIGKQWMWKIQHSNGRREINRLHVPANQDVKLVMTTEDVIHSFFLPAFRIKMDVVPGRYTSEWFRANRIGNFPMFCAQYCGAGHSLMVGRVIVMTPQDYAAWLEKGRPAEPLEAAGARLFRELGCSGCHEGRGIVRAPPLEGLYGKPVPLQSGQVVQANAQYIHDSIMYPKLQIAAGYPNVMPSFKNQVSEEQIFELVAFIRSLANKSPNLRPPQQP